MKTVKSNSEKKGKQREADAVKPRQHCGTLTYLAECRGTTRKQEAFPREEPPRDLSGRTVRRHIVD